MNMATNETTVASGELFFEGPFNELRPKFDALVPAELITISIDVPAAVTTVLGVQRAVLELKDRIAKELPQFDSELPAKLNVYALALFHAHSLFMMATAPADALQPLVDEGTALHATLLADTSALAQRKLIDGAQLRELKGTMGYKNLALDLHVLAQALKLQSAAIQGKCATTPAEIERADQIAATILQVVGIREQEPATLAATSDMRTRAFTVMVKAYDQVRRAISYLRWMEEDADELAPSLYAGRGGPAKKKTDVPVPAPTPAGTSPVGTSTPAAPTAPVAEAPPNGAKTGPGAQPFLTTH
jgi:hypothetical protein